MPGDTSNTLIRTLSRSVRGHVRESALAPILMAFEVVIEVIIPFGMASLIDDGITGGDMGHVVRMGSALAALAALSLTFGAFSGVYAARASAGFAANLRSDLFRRIQGLSFPNMDRFPPSSLMTRLTTDVNNIMMAYGAVIRMAVRAVLMVSFALAMSFRINSSVALVFVGAIPVLGAGLFTITMKVHPIFVRAFKRYDSLNNVVGENLRGIRVVKSYAREAGEAGKFSEASGDIYRDFTKAQKRVAFNMPFLQLCIYSCTILISWVGARLIVSGSMSTGELMGIVSYSMMILMSLNMLSFVFVMIVISRTSAKRVMELYGEVPAILPPANPVTEVADGSISFSGVGFSYVGDAGRLCLKGVDLTIGAGETVGIIGGTGSAKSTLVQLIPRLYDVTSGSVKVGGVDVRDYDPAALRDAVAMVLQKNTLFSGTVAENLRWGDAQATDGELREACGLAMADGFIMDMPGGYGAKVEQEGLNLSGGQKQRLCIARALLKRPKVLILDDSTSAVDARTEAAIRKSLSETLPETTKLIIAQRISSVMDADRIIVMDGAGVGAVGTHGELMAGNAVYREVCASQARGVGDFDEG
ncbi:MAG: ABC transporter ATP-binding protein/permease [Oscillospiraceae bacterium]|nr:ABC transporter ATP-binding protein/permease [Oscillospiraceae bacterium]